MAVTYIWPGTLPQRVREDYTENSGALILRTPTDAGPAKLRRRGIRPSSLSVSFHMTDAQVATLNTFLLDTLRGVTRFGFPHPRLNTQVEVRVVPSGDGQLYSLTYITVGYWIVSMNLEVLP